MKINSSTKKIKKKNVYRKRMNRKYFLKRLGSNSTVHYEHNVCKKSSEFPLFKHDFFFVRQKVTDSLFY